MQRKFLQETLLLFALIGELICYSWIVLPCTDDEFALKIIIVGFVGTPIFLILCGKVYLIHRRNKMASKASKKELNIINGLLAMYPIFMGTLIYILSWIRG